MNKNEAKYQNGITLIVLVVTIVVLLILAGVSIGMLGGENAIITQAQKAKFETEIAEIREKIDVSSIQENNGEKYEFASLKQIIEITDEYNEMLFIENGKLVYDETKVKDKQVEWLENMEIYPKQNVIPIYTEEQFQKIGSNEEVAIEEVGGIVYKFSIDATYYVQNDINFNGSEDNTFTAIGTQNIPFTGILDGQNYTISNVYVIETTGTQGIFSYSKGIIRNLTVNNSYVETDGMYSLGTIAGENSGEIINVGIINTSVIGGTWIGGVAGTNLGKVSNCYVYNMTMRWRW